jgi:hypothetical protein|tara:strand:- start:687 stop:1022 length:336 start_codon:yes stop_codon:yes gene_type:complete
MKSIYDLEKRQQKSLGGAIKEMADTINASVGAVRDPFYDIMELEQRVGRVQYKKGGKSRVNEAGNYTKPTMRKNLFNKIKAGGKGGAPGQWSGRKAQMLAKQYKAKGGGYT